MIWIATHRVIVHCKIRQISLNITKNQEPNKIYEQNVEKSDISNASNMVSSERISPFTHLIESSFLYLIQKADNLNKLLNIAIANQI